MYRGHPQDKGNELFRTLEKLKLLAHEDSQSPGSSMDGGYEEPAFADVKCYLVESDNEMDDYPCATEGLVPLVAADDDLKLVPPPHLVRPILVGDQAKLRRKMPQDDKTGDGDGDIGKGKQKKVGKRKGKGKQKGKGVRKGKSKGKQVGKGKKKGKGVRKGKSKGKQTGAGKQKDKGCGTREKTRETEAHTDGKGDGAEVKVAVDAVDNKDSVDEKDAVDPKDVVHEKNVALAKGRPLKATKAMKASTKVAKDLLKATPYKSKRAKGNEDPVQNVTLMVVRLEF